MTQYEQRILLSALHIATKNYLEQKQLVKEQVNARFPMLSQEYHRIKGELLSLIRICRQLGVKGADMAIQILEDEE